MRRAGHRYMGSSMRSEFQIKRLPLPLLRRLPQQPDQLLLPARELLLRLRLQHEPQVGLGVRGADVGPPGGVVDRDAVEIVDLGVLVALGEARDLPLLVLDYEVDLGALGVAL